MSSGRWIFAGPSGRPCREQGKHYSTGALSPAFLPAAPAACRARFSRCRSAILQRCLNNGRGDKIKLFLLSTIFKIDEEHRRLLLERKAEFLLGLQSLFGLVKLSVRKKPTFLILKSGFTQERMLVAHEPRRSEL